MRRCVSGSERLHFRTSNVTTPRGRAAYVCMYMALKNYASRPAAFLLPHPSRDEEDLGSLPETRKEESEAVKQVPRRLHYPDDLSSKPLACR